MLSSLPPRHQTYIRAALTAAWCLIALGGGTAVLYSPLTIVSELGTIIVYAWGTITMIAGLVAGIGVAADRYRVEWAAAWFAASGLSVYMSTLWWLVFAGETTRLTQAFIVTAAILFMVTRALFCAAHAAKLRAIHSGETGGIDVPR